MFYMRPEARPTGWSIKNDISWMFGKEDLAIDAETDGIASFERSKRGRRWLLYSNIQAMIYRLEDL